MISIIKNKCSEQRKILERFRNSPRNRRGELKKRKLTFLLGICWQFWENIFVFLSELHYGDRQHAFSKMTTESYFCQNIKEDLPFCLSLTWTFLIYFFRRQPRQCGDCRKRASKTTFLLKWYWYGQSRDLVVIVKIS